MKNTSFELFKVYLIESLIYETRIDARQAEKSRNSRSYIIDIISDTKCVAYQKSYREFQASLEKILFLWIIQPIMHK